MRTSGVGDGSLYVIQTERGPDDGAVEVRERAYRVEGLPRRADQ